MQAPLQTSLNRGLVAISKRARGLRDRAGTSHRKREASFGGHTVKISTDVRPITTISRGRGKQRQSLAVTLESCRQRGLVIGGATDQKRSDTRGIAEQDIAKLSLRMETAAGAAPKRAAATGFVCGELNSRLAVYRNLPLSDEGTKAGFPQ